MSADITRAIALVGAAGGLDHDVQAFCIAGEPASKARPRVVKHNVYTPAASRKAEESLAFQVRGRVDHRLPGNIAIAMVFFRSTRHRVDVDNLIKLVLDGITKSGAVWDDDSQVTALLGVLEMDKESPRTIIAIAPHSSSLVRSSQAVTSTCPTCERPFTWTPYPTRPTQTYCSRACASRSRGADLSALANCQHCGTPFRRRQAGQVYCSDPCRYAGGAKGRRKHPPGKCQICGARTSKPQYRRCRSCWLTHREEVAA